MLTDQLSVKEKAELIEQCSQTARDKARARKWDMNIVVFMFAILLITVILLYEGIDPLYLSPIAFFGLAMCWFVSWRQENKLYARYYKQETEKHFGKPEDSGD
jgi:hypothetical protein